MILNSKDGKNWEASHCLLKVNKQSLYRLLIFLLKEISGTKGLSFKNIMYLEKKPFCLKQGFFNQVEEKCPKCYVRFYYLLLHDLPTLFPSWITQHARFNEFKNCLLLSIDHKVSKKKYIFNVFK